MARREARIQLGRVAQGEDPAEERQIDRQAITVKELCALYLTDLNAELILGKGGRPKKQSTIDTDTGHIHRHIVPLLGPRRVKDLDKADINKAMKDIMAGKTAVSVKTAKLRGKAIVRGGAGTAARTNERTLAAASSTEVESLAVPRLLLEACRHHRPACAVLDGSWRLAIPTAKRIKHA